jgi:hypothetical protein
MYSANDARIIELDTIFNNEDDGETHFTYRVTFKANLRTSAEIVEECRAITICDLPACNDASIIRSSVITEDKPIHHIYNTRAHSMTVTIVTTSPAWTQLLGDLLGYSYEISKIIRRRDEAETAVFSVGPFRTVEDAETQGQKEVAERSANDGLAQCPMCDDWTNDAPPYSLGNNDKLCYQCWRAGTWGEP